MRALAGALFLFSRGREFHDFPDGRRSRLRPFADQNHGVGLNFCGFHGNPGNPRAQKKTLGCHRLSALGRPGTAEGLAGISETE
jgi:hypothetical protein